MMTTPTLLTFTERRCQLAARGVSGAHEQCLAARANASPSSASNGIEFAGRLRINASTVLEDARLGNSIAVSSCCLTALARTSVGQAVTSSPRKTMLPEVTSYSGLALRTHVDEHGRFMPACKNSEAFCSMHSNKVRNELKIKGTENVQLRRRKVPLYWNLKGTKDAAREIAPVKEAENVQLRRRKLPSPGTQKGQRML